MSEHPATIIARWASNEVRWTKSRKRFVLAVVKAGDVLLDDVLRTLSMSVDEYLEWETEE